MSTADALLWIYAGVLLVTGLALAFGRYLFKTLFVILLVVVLTGAEPPQYGFKPCPFCRTDVSGLFVYARGTEWVDDYPVARTCRVYCRNCWACGPVGKGQTTEDAANRAYDLWQRRTGP